MSRRKNDWQRLEAIVQLSFVLGVLVVLGYKFSPQFRESVWNIIGIVVDILGVVSVLLLAWIFIRRWTGQDAPPGGAFKSLSPANYRSRSIDFPPQVSRADDSKYMPPAPWNPAPAAPVRPPSRSVWTEPTNAELLEKFRNIDWFQFEKAIELIYRKLGYRVSRRGGANPDGGIDLVVEMDGVSAAIQCKQWKAWKVGVGKVREFLGALTAEGIEHGIFITLRGYTVDARDFAADNHIEILDERDLLILLEQSHVRGDPDLHQALNDERKFCPQCNSEMVRRTSNRGPFWGCTRYPRCFYILKV